VSNPRDAQVDITGTNRLGPPTSAAARDLEKLKAKVEATGRSGKSMSDRFLAGAKALRGAALLGAAAVAKIGADSIKNASQAEQSIGAVQSVFGKYAKTVIKTSKGAADAYGLSANQYRESADIIGSLFKNQGVAVDQLAGKTKTIIGLGADLSAVYGGSAADAVEALSSAFKGEFDPLEKYGLSLKQSTINTAAYALANVKGQTAFGKLSTAQQRAATQQATMNLLMGQGKSALGQFAAQTGTTAEQTQILKAKYTDLTAQLGAKLLPIVNRVLSAGLRLTAWASKHQTAVYAAAAATAVLAAGILALNLAMLANPFGLVVVALALLTAGIVAAWRSSQTFRSAVTAAFNGTLAVIRFVVVGIIDKLGMIVHAAAAAFGWVPGIGPKLRAAAKNFDKFRNTVNSALAGIHDKSVNVNVRYNGPATILGQRVAGGSSSRIGGITAFAAGGTFGLALPGATSRTGGPTPVTVTAGATNVSTAVYLDSAVIRSIARTEVNGSAATQAWRARIGRR
jgi:hypothetical protein